jgi:hypothetical protein
MKVTITGATIEVGERVYVQPDGRRNAVLITVTGLAPSGDGRIAVTGVRTSGKPVTATVYAFQPIGMEL